MGDGEDLWLSSVMRSSGCPLSGVDEHVDPSAVSVHVLHLLSVAIGSFKQRGSLFKDAP